MARKPPVVPEPAEAAPEPPLRVSEPGIYDMGEAAYHADPAPVPSLSRSIAKVMLEGSPAHAFAGHPRLGGSASGTIASGHEDLDVGTAAHAMFLQGLDLIEEIPVKAYQSNDAKAKRDDAISRGMIPLKSAAYSNARQVFDALAKFRERTGLFTAGLAEQTLVWDEGDLWCRCRVDWLPDDASAPLLDLKTTGQLAATWGKTCFTFGGDIQASMYPRGCEFLRGEAPAGMLFIVIETKPPYAIKIFELDPIAVDVGHAKAEVARRTWTRCMNSGEWPSYPLEPEIVLPPPWIISQWESAKIGMADPIRFVDMVRQQPDEAEPC